MALHQSALLDLLAQLKLTDVPDRVRSIAEALYQELIDAEAAAVIGAGRYERSEERITQRNGTRPRTLTQFLRSLKGRGLGGVQLVISDAHSGLKKAIAMVLQGSSWQRCRVHFMRNVLAVVPKGTQEMVASIIRTIFAQPDTAHVRAQFDEVSRMLGRSHPKVATMLDDAKEDLLSFTGFPPKHWR